MNHVIPFEKKLNTEGKPTDSQNSLKLIDHIQYILKDYHQNPTEDKLYQINELTKKLLNE